MRRDLRLQQVEARIQRLPLRFAAREVERERLLPRERILLADEGTECDPWGQEDRRVR